MLLRARRLTLPDRLVLVIDGCDVAIRLRADPRARRYLLRLPPDRSEPVLTIPKGGSLATAERFAERHAGWLRDQLHARPDTVAFEAGALVPLRGVPHRIAPTGRLRGLIETAEGADDLPHILVPGAQEHLPRKLTDWLKRAARDDIADAVGRHTRTLGVRASAISIRDTRSRWGSCASNGRLSFSWRLILAPTDILDYVAAHEVAHLKEMNHSDRFWRLCHQLAPHTPRARQWLRDHGQRLHSYG
ncbi:M48 family metallopeptidase [Polymorphum gilvum]|uniref:Zinc metallopeptidase n=1 Tax=Polymorphum gilvum (strain LMG 25793 / CGMCC 1.9160 / SL003B-26A1) TaxID=991905 RepID=F2IYF4_POLGS|nr:SprT family zinc-dependent metalloprotease [Polymorphum gilvum]ADZ68467.1 Zinc metallopeptidase [Polymorphum gilvum SL003B-26A1]